LERTDRQGGAAEGYRASPSRHLVAAAAFDASGQQPSALSHHTSSNWQAGLRLRETAENGDYQFLRSSPWIYRYPPLLRGARDRAVYSAQGNLTLAICCGPDARYRRRGSAFGSIPPPGFMPLVGGAVSGSMDIFGSTLGGGTAERGSGTVDGRRSIPGSMCDGGIDGVLGSPGCSGVGCGPWPDPFSGV
jgi:hypothetical protein